MSNWTRGQLWDKIVDQAQKNPKYLAQPAFRRDALSAQLDSLVDADGLVKKEATWH